eukprot:TRINITY_DN54901_c0_g1_i1.p1 TRINITY_DN54901_c0_g1~~TRINITY_DN54901_c0_g1_i1.p1  ORF type:complete len:190 (-),score=22.99 TRINITY_DN54901_c0_g1_i1:73-642(-)
MAGLQDPSPPEYLPHPYPLARLPGQQSFASLRAGEQELFPGQSFQSYGEWFEAHRPVNPELNARVQRGRSTSFWPYGQRVTSLVGTESSQDVYRLDHFCTKYVRPHLPERTSRPRPEQLYANATAVALASSQSSPVLRQAGSTATLFFGGNAEATASAAAALAMGVRSPGASSTSSAASSGALRRRPLV